MSEEQAEQYPPRRNPSGLVTRTRTTDSQGNVTDTLEVHPYGHRFSDVRRQPWVARMGSYDKIIGLPELGAGHIPKNKVELIQLALKVNVELMSIAIRNPEVRPTADKFFMAEVYSPLSAYMGEDGKMVDSEHKETFQHKEVKGRKSLFDRSKN